MKFIEFSVPDRTIVPSDLIESVTTVTTTTTQMNMSYGGSFIVTHEIPLEADGVVEAIHDAMAAKPGARAAVVRNPIRVAQQLGSINGRQIITQQQEMVEFVDLAYTPPVTSSPAIFGFKRKAELPIQATGTYDYTVDWGDGSAEESFVGVAATHTYADALVTYEVKVTGLYPGIAFGQMLAADQGGPILKDVISWGDQVYESFEKGFEGQEDIDGTSTGVWSVRNSPNLTACTSFAKCFKDAKNFNVGLSAGNGKIGDWNTSFVNDFEECFAYTNVTPSQNAPTIGSWDMGNAINLNSMFKNVTWSSVGAGAWNFGVAQDFGQMFQNAANYNEDIDDWGRRGSTTATVTNMKGMFFNTQSFNQTLDNWDVSSVTNMEDMFRDSIFDQNIGTWTVSSVTNMVSMFDNSLFDKNIDNWDVSNVINMNFMFRSSVMDKNISQLDVSSVTSMGGMFQDSLFNKNLDNWNVSNVTDMSKMFKNSQYDKNLSNWNVSSVTDMGSMFADAQSFNQNLSAWSVGNVTACSGFSSNTPQWTSAQPNFTACTP